MVIVVVQPNRMGCTGSVVYPNATNEKLKEANGVKPTIKNGKSYHIKGDYSQFQVAKHNREKSVRLRQSKTFAAANEMSGRIIEEREMLSLGTRSRGTSRNTSRTASPTSAKKNLAVKEEKGGLMTPVVEDIHSRDSRRHADDFNHDEDEEELVLVHKKPKTKSPHKVKKKHKSRAAKSKGKTKKHKKEKKTKAGKESKDSLIEPESVDSGMEDNQAESMDEGQNDSEEEADENENVTGNEGVNTNHDDTVFDDDVSKDRTDDSSHVRVEDGTVIKVEGEQTKDSETGVNETIDNESAVVKDNETDKEIEARI